MTSPNHIVAGTFYTGFWASFWNVNIFSTWLFFAATIVFSLLPDVDHTKSPMGIAFFPLAKWLDRKFGHRTITHSIFFLFIGTALIYAISYLNIFSLQQSTLRTVALIFFFAVMSHLILDMITVEGVPLFYPLRRNPCVIPGNREYRLITGKLSTEATAFIIFLFMNFLCLDLYKKGFWTNYNEIFTTIEHMHFERADNPNFTIANYHFIKNGKACKGRALVVASTEKTCELLINDTLVKLDYSTPGLVVKSIVAERTPYPYSVTARAFINVPLSEIQEFVRDRVVSGNISSDDFFTIHFSETQKVGNNINLDCDNHIFIIPSPPQKPADKSNLLKQLAVKKQTLALQRVNFQKQNNEYYRLVSMKNDLEKKVAQTEDPGIRNSLENELIKLNNKLLLMPVPVYTENIVTLEEIKQLQILINKPDTSKNQVFTANLTVINIPSQIKQLQ